MVKTRAFRNRRKRKCYFDYRKRSFGDYFIMILLSPVYLIFKLWNILVWLYHFLFCESVKTSDRIGFGPAFGATYKKRFSWGKTAFVLIIVVVILFLILR